jgi:hypothetical protein
MVGTESNAKGERARDRNGATKIASLNESERKKKRKKERKRPQTASER